MIEKPWNDQRCALSEDCYIAQAMFNESLYFRQLRLGAEDNKKQAYSPQRIEFETRL